jgi:hypothetical protein
MGGLSLADACMLSMNCQNTSLKKWARQPHAKKFNPSKINLPEEKF